MLPGEELAERGVADLRAGVESPEAFLVALFAPRLRRLGVSLPSNLPSEPKRLLYQCLGRDGGTTDTHARTNALMRRMVSYAQALEREQGAALRVAQRRGPTPSVKP